MYSNKRNNFWNSFVLTFILLFFLLIFLPLIIDKVISLFNLGKIPGHDSVIVFKDIAKEYEIIGIFLENLKKLINFM